MTLKNLRKIAIGLTLCFFLAAFCLIWIAKSNSHQESNNIHIQPVDFARLADGSYTGTQDSGLVKATVTLQIEKGRLVNINLVQHDNGLGKKGEDVIPEVIAKQTVLVDTISGATLSSKTILKAIEKAGSSVQ